VPGEAVEGRVTGGAGIRPVLRLTALLRAKEHLRVLPESPGRFRFDHVPLGTWRLQIFAEGCAKPPA